MPGNCPSPLVDRLKSAATVVLVSSLGLGGCGDSVKGAFTQVKGAFAAAPQESLFDVPADSVPDAAPRQEPLSKRGNPASYQQNGQRFTVLRTATGHTESGVAQTYPTNFHGNRTANGEAYDMFAVSAAHKTLPLPSYARVIHQRSGRSVVVRINDRGPFMKPGVIELSFMAAKKLGLNPGQTAKVEIQGISGGSMVSTPSVPQLQQPTARPLTRWTPPRETASTTAPAPNPPRATVSQRHRPIRIGVADQAPATAPPAATPSAAGFDIQAGAFQNRENADRLIARLRQAKLTPARVVLEPSGNLTLYKVRVGPYANRRDAEQAAAALKRFGIRSPRIIAP